MSTQGGLYKREAHSGEPTRGASEGVLKTREFRRKRDNAGRESKRYFNKFAGAPWEPHPGTKGSAELRSKVRSPMEQGELAGPAKGLVKHAPGRVVIRKEDLENHGYTT